MAGKYDEVLAGLQPAPPSDESFQDRVEKEKAKVTNVTVANLAKTYVQLRQEHEKAEQLVSELNAKIEAYAQMLARSQSVKEPGWGEYGVEPHRLRLPSGETLSVQRQPYGQVIDREAYRRWCIRNGYERQLQLSWQTTNGLMKERLLAGEPEPDGTQLFVKTIVAYQTKRGAKS